ncbi:hypothetical protein AURDEDRAFT_153366 [Auricularia subglabra TFB-10046 SS5]|nr:hypothetical protein AURDEDRAFT_153366 [Auricularia subglabra TFB-10046 SS5]
MAFALKPRAPRWAGQPSTFFLLLNACLLTGLLHYWVVGFDSPAPISVWVGHEQPFEQDRQAYELPVDRDRPLLGNANAEPPAPATVGPAGTSCDACGADDALCNKYGADVLARSRSYEGPSARFRRVLRDAKAGKPVKISVLGGSVTRGQGVKRDELWVNVFGEWWKSTFPNSKLTLQNGAVAATGTGYMSTCFLEHIDADADIVLTEFAINDQRTEGNAESFEWLLRQLLDLPKQPAVLNLQTFGVGYAQLTTGGDLHTAIANYYDTPVISMRNALLPQLLDARGFAPAYFAKLHNGNPDFKHINNRGHRMLAELLASFAQRQLCHISHEPVPAPSADRREQDFAKQHVDLFRIPTHRLFQHFGDPPAPRLNPFCASTRTLKHPLVPEFNDGRWSNWSYAAPGGSEKKYVLASEPGAKIAFRVPVRSGGGEHEGAMGRVRVSFLQSSTFGLGIVKCWLDDDRDKAVHVDGFWKSPLNLANTAVVSKDASVGDHLLWCELTGHTRDPEGRTEFRLIGVDAA